MEKYKIRALKDSNGLWYSQYISPANIGILGIVESGKPTNLEKSFPTRDEADKFTFEYLKNELKIPEDMIVGFNNF